MRRRKKTHNKMKNENKHDLLLIIYALPVMLIVGPVCIGRWANKKPEVNYQLSLALLAFMAVWTLIWVIAFLIHDYKNSKKS